MNVKVNTMEFKTTFEKVINGVENKSKLPILESIKIDFSNNNMTLTVNNLEQGIKGNIAAESDYSGSFMLTNLKQFKKALKHYKDTYINFEVSNNELFISNGNKKMNVKVTQQPENFLGLPELTGDIQEYKTNTIKLMNRFNKVKHAVCKNEIRPILAGYHFNNSDIVAIDMHRVALSKDEDMQVNNSFTIPSNTITLLEKCIKKKEDHEISLQVTDKHIKLAYANIEITSRLLEGDYPKYEQIFPQEFTTEVTTNTKQIKENITYLNEFRNKSKIPVIFNINNEFEQEFKDDQGIYKTNTEADVTGDMLTIGVNPGYMLDVLKNIETDNVNIKFVNALNPITIDTETEKYIVLPIRVTA